MKILLAGATGYVGRRLKNRLLEEEDVSLRVLVRDARQVRPGTVRRAEIIEGDIDDRETLRKALEGIDIVYYPIRLFGTVWEPEGRGAAEHFRDACIEAGVKRLVYVGLQVAENSSPHLLKSALDTGIVLSARPDRIQTVWLRVGAVLGSGSVLCELLRSIIKKVPLIIATRWMDVKVATVAIDDVLEYLVRTKDIAGRENLVIDIASNRMSFREMLEATARIMGHRRVLVPLPFSARYLSSFLLMLATPFSFGLSSALIRTVQSGELEDSPPDEAAHRFFPAIVPLPFATAMERAIRETESDQVTSRWVDTLEETFRMSPEDEVSRATYRDVRRMRFGEVPPYRIFHAVKSIGGSEGWFTFDFLWRLRGLLDKLAGGYGTAMGKRASSDLRVGDLIDVWKVVALEEEKRLLLKAQMKVFGKAWLEFKIDDDTLIQTAYYRPHGLPGRLYWHFMVPFHFVIFRDMIRSIVRHARRME
jgi:uncharacterized protein YbjT (DUF2867 family)